MDRNVLQKILEDIKNVRVCVVGDVCLDIYWQADMKKSRLSRETPHFPLPVVSERCSLGGGGNVMANAAALGVRQVLPVSVLGADWRGGLLRDRMAALGMGFEGLVTDETRVSPCYAKPLRAGISDVVYEDPRLDFENYAPLSAQTEAALLAALFAAAEKADAVCVCDQLAFGAVTPAVRQALCALGKIKPVIADSRERIALYKNVIVKPNAVEAAAALGAGALAPEGAAKALSAKTGAPALVTLGEKGAVWCENGETRFIPAVPVAGPVDPVGAGDSFLAAFAAAYAAGAPGAQAAEFACLAAGVTVQKLGETGVASPEEILRLNRTL